MLPGTLCLASLPCLAARPFVTDDARIVDPGGCQIESFAKRDRGVRENEIWFLPACNPWKRVEMTAGGLKVDGAVSGTSSTEVIQAKTLLRPLSTDDFGLALTLGALRQIPAVGNNPARWGPFVNLVGSRSFRADRVIAHANAGALVDRSAALTRHTWGLGAEIALTGRLFGIVESYSQEGEKPSKQLGVRFWAVPNRFQIDATIGWRGGAPGREWLSVGVRALF